MTGFYMMGSTGQWVKFKNFENLHILGSESRKTFKIPTPLTSSVRKEKMSFTNPSSAVINISTYLVLVVGKYLTY